MQTERSHIKSASKVHVMKSKCCSPASITHVASEDLKVPRLCYSLNLGLIVSGIFLGTEQQFVSSLKL